MTAKKVTEAPSVPGRVLFDFPEAAAYLGVTVRWLKRAQAERRVEYLKMGLHIRFEPEALDRLIESARVKPLQ